MVDSVKSQSDVQEDYRSDFSALKSFYEYISYYVSLFDFRMVDTEAELMRRPKFVLFYN